MKLIIEISDGDFYAYRESETAFSRNEEKRSKKLRRHAISKLNDDCLLSRYPDSYFVVSIGKDQHEG